MQAFVKVNYIKNYCTQKCGLLAQRLNKLAEALPDSFQSKRVVKPEKIAIDLIDSTLHISDVQKGTFISNYSDFSMEFSSNKEEINKDSEESLEKYFYNQCVKKKMNLSPSSPFRNISIFCLYQECIEKNIPVEQWRKFINAAFDEQIIVIT